MNLFKSKDEIFWEPYKDKSYNLIYNLLFCDNYSLYKDVPIYSQELSEAELKSISQDLKIETRLRIVACNQLRKRGKSFLDFGLLGVIIEVGLEKGLDTLAVYQDHRSRYINQTGKMVVWETSENEIDKTIDELIDVSKLTFSKIGL